MHGIPPEKIEVFCASALQTIKNLLQLPGFSKDEKGGYLTLRSDETGLVWTTTFVGELDAIVAAECYDYSLEKSSRLLMNLNHISSWLTRDKPNKKYGGGIRSWKKRATATFSGLSEHGDEVVCIEGNIRLGWIDRNDARVIAGISDNNLYYQYLTQYVNK